MSDAPESAFRTYWLRPPPGSALERAIAHGVDPTITFHSMFAMTLEERLERADESIDEMQRLHRKTARGTDR